MWQLDHKEGWALKNGCLKIVLLEKTLVPWTARRSNQSILKKISPVYSLEGVMLKLKPQYFDHLIRRADSLENTLTWGKIEGRRKRGQQTKRWLDGITDLMDKSLSISGRWWRTGKPNVLQSMGLQRVRPNLATEQQQSESQLSCWLFFFF